VATTSLGKVRGRYQKYRSGERGGYYSFKGMRYGAAPTGARRYQILVINNIILYLIISFIADSELLSRRSRGQASEMLLGRVRVVRTRT